MEQAVNGTSSGVDIEAGFERFFLGVSKKQGHASIMAQIDPQQAIREAVRGMVEGFAPEQVRPFPKSHDLLKIFDA